MHILCFLVKIKKEKRRHVWQEEHDKLTSFGVWWSWIQIQFWSLHLGSSILLFNLYEPVLLDMTLACMRFSLCVSFQPPLSPLHNSLSLQLPYFSAPNRLNSLYFRAGIYLCYASCLQPLFHLPSYLYLPNSSFRSQRECHLLPLVFFFYILPTV